MKIFGIVVLIISVFMDIFKLKNILSTLKSKFMKAFTFADEIREPTEEAFKSNFGSEEVIAIHLRRGDYLKYPHHPVQDLEYYEKGLSHMPRRYSCNDFF
jgi:hypothetical protein